MSLHILLVLFLWRTLTCGLYLRDLFQILGLRGKLVDIGCIIHCSVKIPIYNIWLLLELTMYISFSPWQIRKNTIFAGKIWFCLSTSCRMKIKNFPTIVIWNVKRRTRAENGIDREWVSRGGAWSQGQFHVSMGFAENSGENTCGENIVAVQTW